MDVSFIIPVYNTPVEKLQRCFEAFAGIQGIKYEVIVVDDGSEEKIGQYCSSYAQSHLEFVYIHKENGGVSQARNTGIRNASGKFIAFVDSDDVIVAQAYDESFKNIDAEVIIYDVLFTKAGKTELSAGFPDHSEGYISAKEAIAQMLISNNLNGVIAKLYERSYLNESGLFFDSGMKTSEDADFVLSLFHKKPSIYYTKRIAYIYFFSVWTGKNRMRRYPEIMLDNDIYSFLKKREILDTLDYVMEERQRYLCVLESRMSHTLFMDTVELMHFKVLSDSLKNKITDLAAELKHSNWKKWDSKSNIMYFLLIRKWWWLIKCVGAARSIYLKVRYRNL